VEDIPSVRGLHDCLFAEIHNSVPSNDCLILFTRVVAIFIVDLNDECMLLNLMN